MSKRAVKVKNKKKLVPVIGLIILQAIVVIFFYQDAGISIESEHHKWSIFGINFHAQTMLMVWLVSLIMVSFALIVKKGLKEVPGRLQSFFEVLIMFFDGLCTSTLGKKGRAYFPLVMTLFMFVIMSNMMGLVPAFWHFFNTAQGGVFLPWLQFAEPTRDLNVPFGLMIIVMVVVHASQIKMLGVKGYLKSYCEPVVFFAPLNIIGEIAKGVSLAFRLFGNILGGAIIIVVVSSLVRHFVMPVFLNAFFGIFVGTIQAFVFAMLALTYTAVAIDSGEKEGEVIETKGDLAT